MPDIDFHFFASSVSTWVTTTSDRTLPDVIKMMEDEGRVYNLFMVPVPPSAHYAIEMYQPQVEGSTWLGCYTPRKRRNKRAV